MIYLSSLAYILVLVSLIIALLNILKPNLLSSNTKAQTKLFTLKKSISGFIIFLLIGYITSFDQPENSPFAVYIIGLLLSLLALLIGLIYPKFFSIKDKIFTRYQISFISVSSIVVFMMLLIGAVSNNSNSSDLTTPDSFNTTTTSQIQKNNQKLSVTSIPATQNLDKKNDWETFNASPENTKLSENIRKMQKNKLEGANFLPFNGSNKGLGDFMKANNLKFSDVSLDCMSNDSHCELHVYITRSNYPSKINGYICGAPAHWTAPYTDLEHWTPNGGMALPPLLNMGNIKAVLNKIDYEHDRHC